MCQNSFVWGHKKARSAKRGQALRRESRHPWLSRDSGANWLEHGSEFFFVPFVDWDSWNSQWTKSYIFNILSTGLPGGASLPRPFQNLSIGIPEFVHWEKIITRNQIISVVSLTMWGNLIVLLTMSWSCSHTVSNWFCRGATIHGGHGLPWMDREWVSPPWIDQRSMQRGQQWLDKKSMTGSMTGDLQINDCGT